VAILRERLAGAELRGPFGRGDGAAALYTAPVRVGERIGLSSSRSRSAAHMKRERVLRQLSSALVYPR
jgi:hypothetical protein